MSECCGGDSGLGAVGIPTSTPSGGEGFVRSIRWVDLRIGPGGDGTEAEPYNTVGVGFTAIPSGGTLMVVGGDASGESAVAVGSKSATIRGLSGQGDDGGRTVVLPLLEYEISTGTQELAFRNVSLTLAHTGTDANLTALSFDHCPSVSLLADGDAPTVRWFGDDNCEFSGEGGAAHFQGGTVNGYDANGSNPITLVSVHITASCSSSLSIAVRGHSTFGAGVTLTAPDISIDPVSYAAAVDAGVTFSSTPAVIADWPGSTGDVLTRQADGTWAGEAGGGGFSLPGGGISGQVLESDGAGGAVWGTDDTGSAISLTTDRLMGRDTAGSGNFEEISVGGGIGFTGSQSIEIVAFTGDVTKTAGGTSLTIAAGAVTDAKLRDSVAYSVMGRASGTTGDPADITAGTDTVLGRNGSANLAFGQVQTGQIANGAVTTAKLGNISSDRLLGRDTPSSGAIEELTVSGGIEFTTAGGIQTSAFGGDVNKSAGGTTLTITNDAVTYAKMQNVSATSRVLGRITSGAGDVEELTGSQVLSLLPAPGSTTQVLYNNGGAFDAASGIAVVASETALAFGATPGTAGAIRMTSDTALVHRNNGNTADILTVYKDATDAIRFGQKTGAFVAPANMGFDVATSGAFAFFVNGSSEYTLDASGMVFGGNYASFGGTPADASEIRMASGTSMAFRNAGNTANILGVYKDPSDSLRFGQPTGSYVAPANMGFDVATSGTFVFYVNAAAEYTFNSSGLAFGGNYASFGTTPAASGTVLRMPFYSSTTTVFAFRNGANNDDVDVLTLGRFGNDIDLGDPSSGNGSQLSLFGTVVNIKPDNATTYSFDNGSANFGTNFLDFEEGADIRWYNGATHLASIEGDSGGIDITAHVSSDVIRLIIDSSALVVVESTEIKLGEQLNMQDSPILRAEYYEAESNAAPANPSIAGSWRIYADSADGKLKARNQGGTIRELAVP